MGVCATVAVNTPDLIPEQLLSFPLKSAQESHAVSMVEAKQTRRSPCRWALAKYIFKKL